MYFIQANFLQINKTKNCSLFFVENKVKVFKVNFEISKKYDNFTCKIHYFSLRAVSLQIITKDSNVVVVTVALRALAIIVRGLRRNFGKYISMARIFKFENLLF